MARAGTVPIPTDRYVSPEFAALELDRLWPEVWQLACTVDHVAHPGDVYEHRLGPLSVLVVRNGDGELRAFQNACRHRGSAICEGTEHGLPELRCPFHRWAWDLDGRLREIPSRRVFGAIDEGSLDLIPARVGTWGPLVFVSVAREGPSLEEFLEGVPDDCAWADLDSFRCTAMVSVPARCNWKTLIDGFSETYHVQGIHPEMLAMCDDVRGPQRVWDRHGKLEQPYGVASPRLRPRPDDQRVWEGFVEIMGNRVGLPLEREAAGPAPPIPDGGTLRDAIGARIVERGRSQGHDYSHLTLDQLVNMQQYNLFPNLTVLVFSDMLNVVRARPGPTPEDAWMDAFAFERRVVAPDGTMAPRTPPFDLVLDAGGELPLGLVLNQDVANFERAHRGLHQPGLTHLTVSVTEECRIVNLHRNLERHLGLAPVVGSALDW